MSEPDLLLDAWDYKGRPADRASTGGWVSAAMILGSWFLGGAGVNRFFFRFGSELELAL